MGREHVKGPIRRANWLAEGGSTQCFNNQVTTLAVFLEHIEVPFVAMCECYQRCTLHRGVDRSEEGSMDPPAGVGQISRHHQEPYTPAGHGVRLGECPDV